MTISQITRVSRNLKHAQNHSCPTAWAAFEYAPSGYSYFIGAAGQQIFSLETSIASWNLDSPTAWHIDYWIRRWPVDTLLGARNIQYFDLILGLETEIFEHAHGCWRIFQIQLVKLQILWHVTEKITSSASWPAGFFFKHLGLKFLL